MNGSPTYRRLRLVGALGGAVFATLTLVAFLLNPGPSSEHGIPVVEYYSTHGTETLWGAAFFGVAAIFFLWFAETFGERMGSRAIGIAGAAATVALYSVTVGCWEILAEIFGGVDLIDVSSNGYSTALVLRDIGNGAAHMGNFPATAYVGATAAAMLTSTPSWRRLGWVGVGVTVLRLISALVELASNSRWSDEVTIVGFLAFLAWVFAASAMLVWATRRSDAHAVPETTSILASGGRPVHRC
jgi:hypothetical protein